MKRYFAIGGVSLLGLSYLPTDDPPIVYLKYIRCRPWVALAKITNDTKWLNNTLISGADFNSIIKRYNKYIMYCDWNVGGLMWYRYSKHNRMEFYPTSQNHVDVMRDHIFDVEVIDSAYVGVCDLCYRADKVMLSNGRRNKHKIDVPYTPPRTYYNFFEKENV